MVCLVSGVLERSENVFALKVGVVRENFFHGGSGGQKFKDIRHTNPHTADAWASTAFAFFDCDSFEPFRSHLRAPFICPPFYSRRTDVRILPRQPEAPLRQYPHV